jgi:hypothetical protein
MKRKKREDKDISRRDFMKKSIKYVSASAVLGGMAAVQGISPPEAEAQTGGFIDFMKAAQNNPTLANDFVNQVNPRTNNTLMPNFSANPVAAQNLSGWFSLQKPSYTVDTTECATILEICGIMSSLNVGKVRDIYANAKVPPVQPMGY